MTASRPIVAVVDDDPGMLTSLEHLLDAHGYAVESFGSAETFVNRKSQNKISCLILDIHLGGMSGFDLQRQLSARGCGFPVIFMTAIADERSVKTAYAAGCALLRKPFSSSGLIGAIRTAIDGNV